MRISLILAAGGAGLRFRQGLKKTKSYSGVSETDKLLLHLRGEPLLLSSLRTCQAIPEIKEMIIAGTKNLRRLIAPWLRSWSGKRIQWVRGGMTRAESVWRALKKANPKNGWVMVHDGARPLTSVLLIRKLIEAAAHDHAEGFILARKVIPTIKKVALKNNVIERTLDRRFLYEAETPQLIRSHCLRRAYAKNAGAFEATDESSLLESVGACVKVVAHAGWNPKITTYEDYRMAQAYETQNSEDRMRVGFGRDTHRLIPGRRLYLGGIHIPHVKGALGHSDGDALLHAVMDGLLGAAGAGDIGDHFSDRNPRWKGIRSSKMMKAVLEKIRRKGWLPAQVDSVIILQKPHLGSYKRKMRKTVAGLLGLAEDRISIKAKTLEGLGPEGQGAAVTCEALVAMKRA